MHEIQQHTLPGIQRAVHVERMQRFLCFTRKQLKELVRRNAQQRLHALIQFGVHEGDGYRPARSRVVFNLIDDSLQLIHARPGQKRVYLKRILKEGRHLLASQPIPHSQNHLQMNHFTSSSKIVKKSILITGNGFAITAKFLSCSQHRLDVSPAAIPKT